MESLDLRLSSWLIEQVFEILEDGAEVAFVSYLLDMIIENGTH